MGVDNNKSKFNVYYLTLQFFSLISWFIQNEYKFELKGHIIKGEFENT